MSIGFVGRVKKSIAGVEPFHLTRFRPEELTVTYYWESIDKCIITFSPLVADPWSSPENTKLELSHGNFQHHVSGQETLFGESLHHVELNVEQTLQPADGKITVQGITKSFVIEPPFTSIEISYNKRGAIVKINDAKDAYLLRVFHKGSCVYDELEGVDRTFGEKFLDYLFDKMTEPINLQIKIYREEDVLEHKREYFEEHFEEYYEHIDEGDLKSILCEYDEDIREYICQDSDWDLTDVLSEFDIELSDFEYDESVEGFFDFFWLNQFHEQEFILNPPELEYYELRYEANFRFDTKTGYFIEIECHGIPQKLNVINPEITIQSQQHPEQKLTFNNKFSIGNTSINTFTKPVKFNQISDRDYELEFVDQIIGLNYTTTISNHQYLEVECVETLEHISDDEVNFIDLNCGPEFQGEIELSVINQDKLKQIIHTENLSRENNEFSISINELRRNENGQLVIDEIFQYTECEELDIAIKIIPKGDERYGCIEKSVTIRRYPNSIIEAIDMSLNPALTPKIRVLKPYFKGLNFQLQFGPKKGCLMRNLQISGHWLELMPDLEKYRSLINTENNKWILHSLDPSNEFNQVEIASGEIEINKVDINNPGKLEIYELGENGKVLLKNSGIEMTIKWPEPIDVSVHLKPRHSESKILLHTAQFNGLLNLNAIFKDNLNSQNLNFNSLKQKQYDIEISVKNQDPWLINLEYQDKIDEHKLIEHSVQWAKDQWDGSVDQLDSNPVLVIYAILKLREHINSNHHPLGKAIIRKNQGFISNINVKKGLLKTLSQLEFNYAKDSLTRDLEYGTEVWSYVQNLTKIVSNSYLQMVNDEFVFTFLQKHFHIYLHFNQIRLLDLIQETSRTSLENRKIFDTVLGSASIDILQKQELSVNRYVYFLEKLQAYIKLQPDYLQIANEGLKYKIKLAIKANTTLPKYKPDRNNKTRKTNETIVQTSKLQHPTPKKSSTPSKPVKPRSNPIPRKSLPTSVPKTDKKSKRRPPPARRGGRKNNRNKSISKSSDSGNEKEVPGSIEKQFKNIKKEHDNGGKKRNDK